MNILAIDTTTNQLLVAVKKGDILYKNQPQTTMKHLEVALPQVDYVLNEAKIELKDLDYIAVNVGPGSFTGIRIGIATAKGILCVNKDIKVVPVNSLEILAYNVVKQKQKQDFMVVIPSTLEKFYSVLFKDEKQVEAKIITKKELEEVKDIPVYSYTNSPNIEAVEDIDFIEYVEHLIKANTTSTINELKPVYMSLCQAEEELLLKEKKNSGVWDFPFKQWSLWWNVWVAWKLFWRQRTYA